MIRRRRGLATALPVLAILAPAALAQGFQHDTGQPIEITADSLEVVQADRLATFAGNVDAVQGEVVLSADLLRVFYRGSGDPVGDAGSTGTIRRIEAVGNVVVTSPRETAEGTEGAYDVAGSLITLDGDVVLTRDDNVIRGDRLELDLTTGVSRVVARTTASEGAAPEQRVRAVFSPNGDDEPENERGNGKGGRKKDRAGDAAGPDRAGAPIPARKPGEEPADGGSPAP